MTYPGTDVGRIRDCLNLPGRSGRLSRESGRWSAHREWYQRSTRRGGHRDNHYTGDGMTAAAVIPLRRVHQPVATWIPGAQPPALDPDDIAAIASQIREPVHIVT